MSVRSKAVTTKFTEQELRQLEDEAKYHKQSKSELIRVALDQFYDQLHIFKEIDSRIDRLEEKINKVSVGGEYMGQRFTEIAKREKAIYLAIKELIELTKAGGQYEK